MRHRRSDAVPLLASRPPFRRILAARHCLADRHGLLPHLRSANHTSYQAEDVERLPASSIIIWTRQRSWNRARNRAISIALAPRYVGVVIL